MLDQNQNLKINQQIKNTFEKNFSTLSLASQEHYALRMYRIAGLEKYLPSIIKFFKKNLPVLVQDIQNFSDQNYQKKRGLKLLKDFKTGGKKRRRLQKAFYLKNPKTKFLINLILWLQKLKNFGLDHPCFSQVQNDLKEINHAKTFLSHQYFQIDPSEAINTIYFLKNLKIINLTPQIKPFVEQTLMSIKSPKPHQYEVFIYGLTHIIINESNFYQKFVSEEKCHWVLTLLENNLQQIIIRTNSDIVAEVGLCFKLARSPKKEVVKKTQEFIIKNFDEKIGFIPKNQQKKLENSEHSNILAIMLLTDFKKLYPGPELSKYFYE